MKRSRRTKIVATLGPASDSPEMIGRLHEAGADVFRLNMSHLPRERLREKVDVIRGVEAKAKRPIAILADLQGPKLRVGAFHGDGTHLLEGQRFTLDADEGAGDGNRVYLPHPEILSALEPGHTVLIDDGKLRLTVEDVSNGRAVTRVAVGGRISNRKGVSLPDTTIPVAALTDKDRSDLEAALDAGADWIALSFVQRPEDIADVKKVARGKAQVMAKLEKPQAITRLDDILDVSDAIMVARGDLGVEMPLEKVPGLQKRITRAARRAGKPVVVATQMLESMISAPVPTRAEVSDVATAVYEGADAVMLSAESAAGRYPVEAVRIMSEIIAEVEQDPHYRRATDAAHPEPEATVSDVICDALRRSAAILPVAALVTYTAAGTTALRAARERPAAPILSLTPDLATARRLALVWGTHAVHVQEFGRLSEIVDNACAIVTREGFARSGDTIAVTGGMPFGISGGTNLLRIAQVPGEPARG